MAQYAAFEPTVEVRGAAVLAVLRGMDVLGKRAAEILARHNMPDPQREKWYLQQDWLNAFKEISGELGAKSLFDIGKAIPETAEWPETEIESIQEGLKSINVAYQRNHRGGDIGSYDYYSLGPRKSRMICQNPYPDDFDHGLITAVANKYKPSDVFMVEVEIDAGLPTRTSGGDLCSYIITW